MKILKLKSILFSVVAITAVTVFLSSCEKDTTEIVTPEIIKNNIDSESTLNSNQEDSDNSFKNMVFENTEVPVLKNDNSDDEGKMIVLNGKLLVSAAGEISGGVSAISNDKTVNGNVFFMHGIMIYQFEDKTVELNLDGDRSEILLSIGGNKKMQAYNFYEIIDELVEHKASKTNELEIEQQATYAFIAILSSEAWTTNVKYAMTSNDLSLRACNGWEWSAVVATFNILSAAYCGFAGASCTIATATIGTVPCGVLTAACGYYLIGATGRALAEIEKHFCPDCTEPRGLQHGQIGSNRYKIWWDGTPGDSYIVYYGYPGQGYRELKRTSNKDYYLTLNNDGVIYIGVSTQCGGESSAIKQTIICHNC